MFDSINALVFAPFKSMGAQIIDKVPAFIAAVILLVVGGLAGKLLKKLSEKALVIAKFDTISEKIGISEFTYRIGLGRSPSMIIGVLVYWLIFLFFVVSAAEVLSFKVVSELLNNFILFIPRLIAAIFVLAVGVIVGNLLEDVVIKAGNASSIKSAAPLGRIAKIIVIIYVCVMALEQLKIGTLIVSDTLRIILASIGIAVGIAFGLGGKDVAAEFLRSFLKKKE